MKRLLALACLSLAVAGIFTTLSSAAFTGSTSIGSNGVTVDKLANYFSVTPLNGTIASGNVDSLALDFGTVPSARTFTSVFRVTNVSGAARTATLALSNVLPICARCDKPVINLTGFTGAVGEHYVLTDQQLERFEAILEDSGIDVSDDELCAEHA